MLTVDRELSAIAAQRGLVYTRYSDDLTISAAADFGRRDGPALVEQVAAILKRSGFRLHRGKTRIVPPGTRHIVLGLLVGDSEVRLCPEYKRRLEIHVRGVTKFGLARHANHRNFDSVLSMISHVDGAIAFAQSVEPAFAADARTAWNDALRANEIPA